MTERSARSRRRPGRLASLALLLASLLLAPATLRAQPEQTLPYPTVSAHDLDAYRATGLPTLPIAQREPGRALSIILWDEFRRANPPAPKDMPRPPEPPRPAPH